MIPSKGDIVKVQGCKKWIGHKFIEDNNVYEGEFIAMCSGYNHRFRVKVNGVIKDFLKLKE